MKGCLNMDWNDPEQYLVPKEEGRALGAVEYIYEVCGYNAFMGEVQPCPRCKEDQAENECELWFGCGQHFAVAVIRGEPEHPNRPRNIIASIDINGCPFE